MKPTVFLLLLSVLGLLPACAGQSGPVAAPASPTAVTPPVTALPTPAPVPVVPAVSPRALYVWPFTTLQGTDYVSLADLAARYGMKAAWTKPDLERTLADPRGVRFRFETNQRDAFLDGVRLFFGAPVRLYRGDLWVSKLDVIKVVAPVLGPADLAAHLPAHPPRLIVLDPGHGGTDPGKQNLTLKLDEKDMTLDVAWRLRKILELRGYQVLMTRETDTRFSNSPAIDLPWRAEVANRAGADLFLSIHFNAVDPRNAARVTGTETYVLTPQFMVSTQAETDTTMQQVLNPGNRQDAANALLGFHLHKRLVAGLASSDRGFKRYRYAVLRTLQCPGVLIEAGFLSQDEEAGRIGTPAFRQQIAEHIAAGVLDYTAILAALHPAPPSVK